MTNCEWKMKAKAKVRGEFSESAVGSPQEKVVFFTED